MLEQALLRRTLPMLVQDGRVKLTDWKGRVIQFEGPKTAQDRPWLDVTIHSFDVVRQMATRPQVASLAFGEAYVNGDVTFGEGYGKDAEQLKLFFELLAANAGRSLPQLMRRADNSESKQQQNIGTHYDVSYDDVVSMGQPSAKEQYFDRLLGETRLYSCAYRKDESTTLDQAQRAKTELLLNKLGLEGLKRPRLLDVGCGSGYLAVAAAKKYGARVTGITISREQLVHARLLARREGVEELVQFELLNYQELPVKLKDERFDRIVSVGMFEHVGAKDYELFFRILSDVLVPGGVFVLHTITQETKRPISPFVDKHIFPGGYLPTLEEIAGALKGTGLRQEHYEDLCQHYAWTLEEWAKRHLQYREEIEELLDEEFWRTRWLWLWASWAGFRHGTLGLGQFVIRKGKPVEPVTRDSYYELSTA
jgi:cyclopropane-fatty-acyl-phospholipid synthase